MESKDKFTPTWCNPKLPNIVSFEFSGSEEYEPKEEKKKKVKWLFEATFSKGYLIWNIVLESNY